jgi:hypothetical protein
MKEIYPMFSNLLDEGIELIKEASIILESISNSPGVTSKEFYKALDLAGIHDEQKRDILFLAATSIEVSMESIDNKDTQSIH